MQRWIIAYDVADPRRRYHICKALKKIGARRQFSVFDADLTERTVRRLAGELECLMGPGDDIRFFPASGRSTAQSNPRWYLV